MIAETQGNTDLLKLNKTAFLCSRRVPALAVLKCYDWAIAQREAGNCVISGFHSRIEKDVLHYLLKGQQPIIIALARSLKKNIEPELQKPLENGRLLLITPFGRNIKQASRERAAKRNKMMTELSDSITIGFASPGGQIEKLLKQTDKPVNRIYTLPE